MLPRERVMAALEFRAPDRVPVEYHPSPAGMHEHGTRLRDLMVACGHDFGDAATFPIPVPNPRHLNEHGRYRAVTYDEWGVTWESLVFGIMGHPIERPLDDWANWDAWRRSATPQPAAACPAPGLRHTVAAGAGRRYFRKAGWISLFEVMHAVRRFEDVLMDIESNAPEIHRLADAIVERRMADIAALLEQGVDAIQFADDFGTQQGLLLSPSTWARFFRPRYARLMKPVLDAGVRVFFHTCGKVPELLEPLAALGVRAVWPQAALYPERDLAGRCRALGLAVAIHPDRAHLMTRGTPQQVRDAVRRLADIFQAGSVGSWFYVEIDTGFPFENARALIEGIQMLRAGA